ncbi:NAD(P)-dependent dehydrogenase (short-subunit alcohol dehydrogenase family) [Geomicrobium halophilum]|uniref:NAD(P)-dependent dehydrogenase (Short-subunit alcohol dehydrogenase family) n=1 Tax=Geomicrobium halophilum TaxID=549000 RepID=A0A841Q2B8_9BACL|nr:SDR family oxidoreductase [Geomicrobium halophilum]MBB6450418.1 NAD(P)-dependent dehydrogenase (short-subunit alcohol dehydrogenase family) [Geomicrobium halophilum]
MRLQEKVAIVTGGSQGIGKGIARTFGKEGAKVIVADINEELGRECVQELQNNDVDAFFHPTDVSDEASVMELVKVVSDNYGGIDILVNNAAINFRKAVHETSLEEWNQLLGINLTGPFLCSKYVLPLMQKRGGGSIINIASWHAEKTITRLAAYASAKGGITALTRQMALDYGADQIRVNAVGPSTVDTPLLQKTFESLDDPDEAFKQTLDYQPMGRIGTTEDIANACLFLASDESTYVSGQTLMVDGGAINKIARPLMFD